MVKPIRGTNRSFNETNNGRIYENIHTSNTQLVQAKYLWNAIYIATTSVVSNPNDENKNGRRKNDTSKEEKEAKRLEYKTKMWTIL